MRLPEFITFTGADDWTDSVGMVQLAKRYPVEWGILFSLSRQGSDPRYPGSPRRFLGLGLHLAAHLCGGAYSERIMNGLPPIEPPTVSLREFDRVQVNHRQPDPGRVAALHHGIGVQCIVQVRDSFLPEGTLQCLFDASGGRGLVPTAWPEYPGYFVGYAGGIGPDNVQEVIEAIDAPGPYWIDMESGVRTDEKFDLAKCLAVCETVYGKRIT